MSGGATVGRPASFTGVDLSGRHPARVCLCPAGPGTGIWFNRSVRATLANAGVSDHATCVGKGRRRVRMVEHLLSACCGLGITDLAVETTGSSLPMGDGSAAPYVRLLKQAGIVRYKAGPEPVRLRRPVLVTEGQRFIAAIPARRLVINCLTRYAEFGPQSCSFPVEPALFVRGLAPARTLAHTGSRPAELRRRFALRFGLKRAGRFVLAARLRFPDEPCRHKALDLLGDLALLGRPLEAEVFACMPGHDLNLKFCRKIERSMEA